MPLALKRRIKILADLDKRTMASWAAIQLEKVVEDVEKSKLAPLMMVADDKGKSSRSIPAAGAPEVKYPQARRRKA